MATRKSFGALALALLAFAPHRAAAHPHVFAEARLDVVIGAGGNVESLRHLWRFDDLFSSTVLVEFDKNGDLQLDTAELEEVGAVVKDSIGEYGYFQTAARDGAEIAMAPPEVVVADMQDQKLIILFESKPAQTLPLGGKLSFGVYDPTFYTAIEFTDDSNMSVKPLPQGCATAVIRPDPEEAIAQNQDSLTEAFYDEAATNDLSKMFATRLEIDCPQQAVQ